MLARHAWALEIGSDRPNHRRAYPVLAVSTLAFMVCFAVWMMFGVIGIPIRKTLGLNNTEFGLLTATPVLLGALMRLPLGIWTDRFGGRIVMTLLLVIASIPVYLASYATQYWQLLAIGLLLGIVGASFAVGTPYCARFFPQEKRGFAMGVFGAGTVGAALNMFVAPRLIESYGWEMVPQVYAVVLLVTGIVFWLVAAPDPGAGSKGGPTLRQQLAVLKDPRVWKLCQYYSLAFGGFTALSLWMTQYYIQEYGFDVKVAGTLAMAFALPAGILRAFGGWLSDRFGAHSVTWWVLWAAWIVLVPDLVSADANDDQDHRWPGILSPGLGTRCSSRCCCSRWAWRLRSAWHRHSSTSVTSFRAIWAW